MSQASAKAPKFCPACSGRFSGDALFCPNDGTPLLAAPPSDPGEATPAPTDPYLGRELLGHIEIRQLAGVGAMGRVYRAFQKGIDRDVAVKILHRELSANPQLVSRFHREAKVASRLQHPNVVHVHLAGQLPDGALYIVMEYLDGLSLQSALGGASGSMSLQRALHIALQLCDAVGEAHAQGVVHRDLKPENVMLVRRGQDPDYVKVLDFGIARLSWGEQSMATAAGLIFGTARYISPEGAQGEGVGPTGDVYAIATLLYQMLAGRTPFEGDQAVGLLIQQIHDAPPELRSIPRASYLPEPLARAIMKNLAKSQHARDPDARAFGRALVDASKLAGLSTEDLVARPMLLGASTPGPMKLAPMQQTKQLELSPDLAERLGGPVAATPAPSSSRHAAAAPAGTPASASTVKWTPPGSIQAQMAQGVAAAEARPPSPSGVDRTLDDGDVPPPPPAFPAPRTQIATTPQAPAPAPREPTPAASRTAPPSYPSNTPAPPSAPPSVPAMRTPLPTPSKPFSNVDTTLSDEPVPGRFLRYAVAFVLLFLVGSLVTGGVLYKLGLFEPSGPPSARLEEILARADDAEKNGRWDDPPGDNVRDLTTEGLATWPKEPRLLHLRKESSEEILKRAIRAKSDGDLHAALHWARLASELDPSDEAARALAHEYEAEAVPATPDAAALLFLADAGTSALTAPPTARPAAALPRIALDANPTKPRLGQSVELTAKVTTASGAVPREVADAHFAVAGPGMGSGARLAAMTEGNVFHGGFTFLERGKFEISFSAKVDGAQVRTTRVVVVDAPTVAPPGTVETPVTAPSGSVKWL